MLPEKPLTFGYCAMALFRKRNDTEIRVVLVDANNLTQAVEKADKLMRSYANDFEFTYSGTVNVYEFGSDMLDEYGEVYSIMFESDNAFDAALEDRLGR